MESKFELSAIDQYEHPLISISHRQQNITQHSDFSKTGNIRTLFLQFQS